MFFRYCLSLPVDFVDLYVIVLIFRGLRIYKRIMEDNSKLENFDFFEILQFFFWPKMSFDKYKSWK